MPTMVPLRGIRAYKNDAQNPMLIPNMDYPVVSGNNTLDVLSPYKYDTTYARTDATVTLDVTGTITNLDTITLTFTNTVIPASIGSASNNAGAYTTAAYTVVTADTTTTIAEGLESLVNLDSNLGQLGIYATMAGTSHAARVILRQSGPVGNSTTVTATITGSATEILTFGNSGVMASGAGPVVPIMDFKWSYNNTVVEFWYAKPKNVGSDLLAALITGGAPII